MLSVEVCVVGRVHFVFGARATADDIQLARDHHGGVRGTPLPKTAATCFSIPHQIAETFNWSGLKWQTDWARTVSMGAFSTHDLLNEK